MSETTLNCLGEKYSSANLTVRNYEEQDAEAWDRLVDESLNGTFLHKRRFLSYHGKRFEDVSLVINDNGKGLVGVLPAALDPTREGVIISHPGSTYGGVVHKGRLRGAAMVEALHIIAETYRDMGLRMLQYKVVPHIYHRVFSNDDLYALFRLGAVRYRCDLSATIELTLSQAYNKQRRRDLKKAQRSSLYIEEGAQYLAPYWAILEKNLATKHATRPTHTLREISHLQNRFPEEIRCVAGMIDDEVVSGVILFRTPRVDHVQYSGSSPHGDAVGAQTAVMDYAIGRSRSSGKRYFDFGISNENQGKVLNEGLYRFKSSFGAEGTVHEFYQLDLYASGPFGSSHQ